MEKVGSKQGQGLALALELQFLLESISGGIVMWLVLAGASIGSSIGPCFGHLL